MSKSAARVLGLLEYFAAHGASASVNDIRYALEIPQSSASMLLRYLYSVGYLAYDTKTRRYAPSRRLTKVLKDIQHSDTGQH